MCSPSYFLFLEYSPTEFFLGLLIFKRGTGCELEALDDGIGTGMRISSVGDTFLGSGECGTLERYGSSGP